MPTIAECKFGNSCHRDNCWFKHPEGFILADKDAIIQNEDLDQADRDFKDTVVFEQEAEDSCEYVILFNLISFAPKAKSDLNYQIDGYPEFGRFGSFEDAADFVKMHIYGI